MRIADFPRQSRPSAAAPASAPLASSLDSAAAPARALAALNAARPMSQAALQLAAFGGSSVPSYQTLLNSSQSFPSSHIPKVPSGEAPSSGTPSGGTQGGGAQPPGGPPGDPDDDPDKKKRDREIDLKRKCQFLIDSTALRSAKGRSRGNMKCEVDRFERGTDLTIKDSINQMETFHDWTSPARRICRIHADEDCPQTTQRDKAIPFP